MNKLTLIATAPMGLESIVSKELKELGFTNLEVENGRVTYDTDVSGMIKSNLYLRCSDRVHIKIGDFVATTFEELFQGIKALPWADYLTVDGEFIVNAKSVKSTLFSLSDIQSISKKAIINKMKETYDVDWFEEDGTRYSILVSILKDRVIVTLDTSGVPLHKRGYRAHGNEAPIKETLAAALVKLSDWNPSKPLIDPMCGSGTIAIEAAMIGLNIAPGLNRRFDFEDFHFVDKELFKRIKKEAYEAIDYDKELKIYASDIDKKIIDVAKENSELAGVDDMITFRSMDVRRVFSNEPNGVIICNPPYGERLQDEKAVLNLYKDMGNTFKGLNGWSYFIITSSEKFEKSFGRKSDKNRKLYNGRIKCYYYQYFHK